MAQPAGRTCEIRDWPVFERGPQKGSYYGDSELSNMEAAFRLLSTGDRPVLVPSVGLGHDPSREFSASLGFPTLGRVADARRGADGQLYLTLKGLPEIVGAMANGGFYKGGSIEIDADAPDPRDPAKRLPGPVLTGIGLLGREQPAVKMPPPPPAVFEDGSPVPPATSIPPEWLTAMAATLASSKQPQQRQRVYSNGFAHATTTHAIAFSELFTMQPNRQQILEQLEAKGVPVEDERIAAMTDEQLMKLLEQASGMQLPAEGVKQAFSMAKTCYSAAAPAPAAPTMAQPAPDAPAYMSAVFAMEADPSVPAPMKAFAKAFADWAGDTTKRVGGVETGLSDAQKQFSAGEKAAFSAAVEQAVDARIGRGAAPRNMRDALIAEGMATFPERHVAFSAGHKHAGRTGSQVWFSAQAAAAPSSVYADADPGVDQTAAADPLADPFIRRAVQHIPSMRTPDAYLRPAGK